MAKPKFEKGGAPTVNFDRAEQIPFDNNYTIEQNVGRSYGNSKKINSYNDDAVRFITVNFVFLTLTIRDAVVTFFEHTNVNWRANSFDFTDSDGNLLTVRLAQDTLPLPRITPGDKFSMQISLEVE